ncbi:MAG TPA: VanW family protein [Symbiobacteriaceae bacterium]|nr:VanW family protein [Symbiobacteriaceae bacterium]
MRLTERFPALYHLRVAQLRLHRILRDTVRGTRFARTRAPGQLPVGLMRHQSVLRRQLGNVDPQLQENKVTNLRIATATMDGLLIRPGETFAFWERVGMTTARKGYLPGLLLRYGEADVGVGGGVCQLSNLLYWMALHTPLQVVERHHHSFDAFPDSLRVLPFGTGACVFYNYVDLRLYNPTELTFQINVRVTEEHLKGSITADQEWPLAYRVVERNHRFVEQNGRRYRENEVWRLVTHRASGELAVEEMLMHNFCEVKYELFGSPTA